MKVEYLTHMGSDINVVNAARVSFDKASVPASFQYAELGGGVVSVPMVNAADAKLIGYLASHHHWSPFAHSFVSFRWTAPIFVARQLQKHQVGFAWNEVSRRYVDKEPELYWPEKYRKAAENVKQGSSDEEYAGFGNLTYSPGYLASRMVETYNALIADGLCPEQARMFLPQNTLTSWIWTGSLYGWARVYNQRSDSTAQLEVQSLMPDLYYVMARLFPVSWKALTHDNITKE